MHENVYLALLRGINVGGKNIIKMSDLSACFESMGFKCVITFIQSGNILFKSFNKDKIALTKKIEKELSAKFDYQSRVVVLSKEQLENTINKAPKGFGKFPDKFKYDVVFLKEPVISEDIIKKISIKDGVDTAVKGDGVLYFSRLISNASKSRLSKIISLPEYQYMTIRNWNTTTKILTIMEIHYH